MDHGIGIKEPSAGEGLKATEITQGSNKSPGGAEDLVVVHQSLELHWRPRIRNLDQLSIPDLRSEMNKKNKQDNAR